MEGMENSKKRHVFYSKCIHIKTSVILFHRFVISTSAIKTPPALADHHQFILVQYCFVLCHSRVLYETHFDRRHLGKTLLRLINSPSNQKPI